MVAKPYEENSVNLESFYHKDDARLPQPLHLRRYAKVIVEINIFYKISSESNGTLCLEEAVGMADDFQTLCNDFAASDIASYLTRRAANDHVEADRRRQQLHFVR